MKQAVIPFMILVGISTLLLVGGTSASARATNDQPAKVAVTIDNFNFGPGSLTIAAGTTVIWTNRDDVPHNVTSTDKLFKSPTLDTGEHWEFTFKQAGTFNYYCSIHPKMTGKVIVQ